MLLPSAVVVVFVVRRRFSVGGGDGIGNVGGTVGGTVGGGGGITVAVAAASSVATYRGELPVLLIVC